MNGGFLKKGGYEIIVMVVTYLFMDRGVHYNFNNSSHNGSKYKS